MNFTSSNSDAGNSALTSRSFSASVSCALLIALAAPGNPAWGRGKPAAPPPDPDIVYLSSSSYSLNKPAVRGVTVAITGVVVNSSDTQLLKALAGRNRGSITWSPDGSRFAWIEGEDPSTAKIMWARPGGSPSVLYQPGDSNDPYVWAGTDSLAWGSACSAVGSVLIFARAAKWDETLQQYTEPSAIMGIDIGTSTVGSALPPSHGSPRLVQTVPYPNAFAFSPTGRHLVFNAGYGTNEKVSILPVCGSSPSPTTLLGWDDFAAARYPFACDDDPGSACPCDGNSEKVCYDYPYPAVQSIDWSQDEKRLALSVIVGPDGGYPWRDLRVAYLDWNTATQTFEVNRVVPINLDAAFGSASSEHSPQWAPEDSNADCERLAFSQSAGASDGSTMNGRRLYLYDVVTSNTACFDGPREIPAREPRAIDWK